MVGAERCHHECTQKRTPSGRGSVAFFPDVKPPKGFKFNGPWQLDMPEDVVNENGWAYGAVWLTRWPPPAGSAGARLELRQEDVGFVPSFA